MTPATLIVMAAGLLAYGPPTHHDAYTAVTDKIIDDPANFAMPAHTVAVYGTATFPMDVRIVRCAGEPEKRIAQPSGAVFHVAGYDCVIEVFPNADPPYRTAGFFYNDGVRWRYHGTVRAAPIRSDFAD